jgi:hypothetical protein
MIDWSEGYGVNNKVMRLETDENLNGRMDVFQYLDNDYILE